jgi:FMN reductase
MEDVVKLAVVVGNPKPQSRTLGVAVAVADVLAAALSPPTERAVIDLAERAAEMFDGASVALRALTDAVATSDLVVVASPTYKGAYTGLLKAFFDRYPHDGLAGRVAVAVMTGASPVHALAVETHLRPLLVDLGATVPARGLYVTEPQLADLGPVIASWAVGATELVRHALGQPATR